MVKLSVNTIISYHRTHFDENAKADVTCGRTFILDHHKTVPHYITEHIDLVPFLDYVHYIISIISLNTKT